MITVHHLEDSRSQRVIWLLEELGVSYDIKRYDRDKETGLGPKALYDIHPLGKSPVITHDGHVIAETGAIFEYVLDTFDPDHRLHPERGTSESREFIYWLHYAEGSAMPPLLMKLVFSRLPERAPGLVRPVVKGVARKAQDGFVDPRLTEHVEYWEASLAATGWFVGDQFSAADIMMSFPLEAVGSRFPMQRYKTIRNFLNRCHDRSAYQSALERGGPYAYA
ncbi:MAG: glutathione S-transferase [Henriciella sp.]|nr:glutathione S-transferase [Henriciella sp.]